MVSTTNSNWSTVKNAQSKAFEVALAKKLGAKIEKYHEDRFFHFGGKTVHCYIAYVPRTCFPNGTAPTKYAIFVHRYTTADICWLVQGNNIEEMAAELARVF